MKKILKKLNSTLFDVATPVTALAFLGKPALIVIAVILIVFITVKLIANKNNKNKEDDIDKSNQHK